MILVGVFKIEVTFNDQGKNFLGYQPRFFKLNRVNILQPHFWKIKVIFLDPAGAFYVVFVLFDF